MGSGEAHKVIPILDRFSKNGEPFELRTVSTSDEIRQMGELWSADYFDPGFENLMQMWTTTRDHAYWLVIVNEEGKVIATRVLNCLSNGAVFAYNIKVHPDYLGWGLAARFQSHIVHMYDDSFHNNTGDTVLRSAGSSLRLISFFHKIVGYAGPLNGFDTLQKRPLPAGITIQSLTIAAISRMLDYDRTICGIERRSFMAKWVTGYPDIGNHPQQITLVAYDDHGSVVGYGTLRFAYHVFCVSPLYADSEDVAYCLMYDLLSRVPQKHGVFVAFPDRSRTTLEIVRTLELVHHETEINAASGWGKGYQYACWLRGNLHKVFATQEFWPV